MKLFTLKFVVLAVSLFSSLSVFAAESLENMYEARVLLADRSTAARNEAISKGLEQVLVRYSGYSDVGNLAGVAPALANAQSYVIEFAVETLQVPASDGLSTADTEGLWIRYNASQVDQLVDRQQLPIWPSLRPSVRYLVIQELFGEPTIMSAENSPAITSALEQTLSARGLPGAAYAPDFITPEEIWRLSEVDAYQLLNESGGDLLLLIKVRQNSVVGTASEIVIVEESGMSVFRERTGSAHQDVTSALNKFVDSYSVDRAFLGGSGQVAEVFLSVVGLGNFENYRQFLDVLSSIEQVTSARLEALKGDQMMFRIAYGANYERLLTAIMRQTTLEKSQQYQNALGTRQNPLVLVEEGYPAFSSLEPMFAPPVVIQPSFDQPPFDQPPIQNELEEPEPSSRFFGN